jgi:diguanylate cyclase (GGDEF)-like protein
MQGVTTHWGGKAGRTILIWIGAAALYYVLCVASVLMATQNNGITTVWPVNGVMVALLLAQDRPRWLTILSAVGLANTTGALAIGQPLAASLAFPVVNITEIALAALLLRRAIGDHPILASPATVGRFILIAGIAAPSISAVGGAMISTFLFGHEFLPSYRIWAWSDGLGLLIFTPMSYALFNGAYWRALRAQHWRERAELAGLLAMVAGASVFVFSTRLPLLFVLFPLVMLTAFRAGRLGTKIAVVLIAAIGAVATAAGNGPIAALTTSLSTQAHMLQVFLAVLLLTCLPVAAALSARRDHVEALAERERILARQAATDGLTGFLNRAAFRKTLATALAVGDRPLCLVAIDLDHFKTVNDRWGHHVGDRALTHMAQTLRGQLRAQDMVGRTGGDEFMLMLPATDLDEAERICSRMRDALRRTPLPLDEGSVALLSISCGIAVAGPLDTVETLAQSADRALYGAKSEGRNAVRRAS